MLDIPTRKNVEFNKKKRKKIDNWGNLSSISCVKLKKKLYLKDCETIKK